MTHIGCNGESMECTECVNNGIKCWCVCMQKGGVKSEKGQERRVRRWKRGEKKTNQDDKTLWHPNTHSPVLSSRLNTHSHEVEVLGTLHSQTLCVCVWQWMTKNKSQVKTQTNHTHSAFGLCLVDEKDQWKHKP